MHEPTPAEKKRKKDLKAFALIGTFFVMGLLIIFTSISPDKNPNLNPELLTNKNKHKTKEVIDKSKEVTDKSDADKVGQLEDFSEKEKPENESSEKIPEQVSPSPKKVEPKAKPKPVVPEKLYAYLGDPTASVAHTTRGDDGSSFKYHLIGASFKTKNQAETYAAKIRRKGGGAIVLDFDPQSTYYRVSIYQSNSKKKISSQQQYLKKYSIKSWRLG